MIFYYLMKKMSNINKEQILQLAFIFVYIAVLTMPHMHERYGYLYEIFAIMLALLYKRTIIPCIILQLITFFYLFIIFIQAGTYAYGFGGNKYRNIHILFWIFLFKKKMKKLKTYAITINKRGTGYVTVKRSIYIIWKCFFLSDIMKLFLRCTILVQLSAGS